MRRTISIASRLILPLFLIFGCSSIPSSASKAPASVPKTQANRIRIGIGRFLHTMDYTSMSFDFYRYVKSHCDPNLIVVVFSDVPTDADYVMTGKIDGNISAKLVGNVYVYQANQVATVKVFGHGKRMNPLSFTSESSFNAGTGYRNVRAKLTEGLFGALLLAFRDQTHVEGIQ